MKSAIRRLLPLVLLIALLLGKHQGFGQKNKTKVITYRGITMKVPDSSPDFESQEPSASLQVSEDIMIHFRLMSNMISTEQAALKFADEFWETRPKERGIPMQMELDRVRYYFVEGQDAGGETNYLLAGANAYGEYYGIYVSYGNPVNAKLSKKTLRSIRAAKSAPTPYETVPLELKTVTYRSLQFDVPDQVVVREIDDGISLDFENMYVATLKKVKLVNEQNFLDVPVLTEILEKLNKRVKGPMGYQLMPGWERALICFKYAIDNGTVYVDEQGNYIGIERGNLYYTELKTAIPEMKSYYGGIFSGNTDDGYVINLNVISEPGLKFGYDLLNELSQ